jgi:hypothetical protein
LYFLSSNLNFNNFTLIPIAKHITKVRKKLIHASELSISSQLKKTAKAVVRNKMAIKKRKDRNKNFIFTRKKSESINKLITAKINEKAAISRIAYKVKSIVSPVYIPCTLL